MMRGQVLKRHRIQKVSLGNRQDRERKKIKINSSRAKIDKRKECQKGSEGEYDDRVSLHVDSDAELAGNMNNVLETNKE